MSGAEPTVSLCIPVFNRRVQLERALRSAREQTHRDLEIVVLDNASTDGSYEVARRHADEDPRVRPLRNSSTVDKPDNWRRVLMSARGRHVTLLFSDDWLAPDAVARGVEVLDSRPDVGFVYSAMTWHTGNQRNTCYAAEQDRDEPAYDFLRRSAALADLVPVTTSCVLMRSEDARAGFVDRIPVRVGEDTHAIGIGYSGMLLWRCAERYPNVRHIGDVLAFSADATTGEQGSRQRYADRYEMLWWGHRTAFAHYLDTCSLPHRQRAELATVLAANTVPLRWGVGRRRWSTLRQMLPDLRVRNLRPWHPATMLQVVHRAFVPPDPREILGPHPPRSASQSAKAPEGHA